MKFLIPVFCALMGGALLALFGWLIVDAMETRAMVDRQHTYCEAAGGVLVVVYRGTKRGQHECVRRLQ